jgi:uncharacterized protein YidB (DUF937 family)
MAAPYGGAAHDDTDTRRGAATSGADFIASILDKTDIGGLHGIVAKLAAAGLDRQVQSWLGDGSNLPITTEQLRSALDSEQVRQVALEFGLPVDAALKILADQLPGTIDQTSPHGSLPPEFLRTHTRQRKEG